MMDVLLANVALWRGRTREAVHEGRERDEAVPGHRRRLGRDPGDGPVVRALAELGEREESETALVRMREVAATLVSEGMQHIPDVVQANIFLQYGHPDDAAAVC